MFFHKFGHIDAHHGLFTVEDKFGQGFGQFGLADTGRSHENKRADGAVGILQTGACPAHGIGNCLHGLILADDPLVEQIFHVHQFLLFAFKHFAHRDTRPAGDHLSHILLVDLFFKHLAAGLKFGKLAVGFLQLFFKFGGLAVTDFCYPGQIAFALSQLGFGVQLFLFFFDRTNGLD